jgi:hypothetical protein
MQDSFLSQIGSGLYQLTSFQLGNFNLADFALNFENSFLNSTFVHILEIISAIITITLFVMAVKLGNERRELNQKAAAQKEVEKLATIGGAGPLQDQWNDIVRHIESPREGEWKFAVIEADTIVDAVLKNYFPGDTMGERLMNINKTQLLSIDGLWEAHKVRNRLAHEPNYFLRHAEALRAIRMFEATLKELGSIQ